MRGERDVHPVVHIEPFGVVILLFGQQGNPGNESESLRKICEAKTALQMFAVQRPEGQQRMKFPARGIVKLLDHSDPFF